MTLWGLWFGVGFFIIVSRSAMGNEIDGKPLHHHMTRREMERYFGVNDIAEVPEYDVAIPYESNAHGHFVSYQLHGQRKRRDTETTNEKNYVKMDALGKTMHLQLTRNDQFMSPALLAETRHEDGTITTVPVSQKNYFLGKLTTDDDSLVAVRKDKGLTGMIRHKDGTMFVHPLPDHLAKHFKTKQDTQPHLVYRASPRMREVKCQTDGSAVMQRSLMEQSDPSNVTHKYLEAALVVDDKLAKFHGNDTFNFLLLLGNMVNAVFHDNSFGNIKITYVVTRLVIISLKELGLGSNAGTSQKLGAMAGWCRKHNVPDDSDPQHFEVASLISRGITGGLAYLGGVCSPNGIPNVNGDYGLQTVGVIAHETAHNMGFGHDGPGTSCPDGRNVMATSLPGGRMALKWSPCTREGIQKWLQRSYSRCLDDAPPSSRPKYPAKFHDKLPGQLKDAHKQCKYQYGVQYWQCPYFKGTCSSLYCTSDGSSCISRLAPVVDGTPCGARHWCISGECVDNGVPRVDGGWSEWSGFSSCSQSCGGGVNYRTRTCTNPSPSSGGEKCFGSSRGQWAICNSEECPAEGNLSFRDLQCMKIEPQRRAWYLPDPCRLACRLGWTVKVYGQVADGTRCYGNPSKYDICIQGKCRSVACDHKLESGTLRDRCGVCGGNGYGCVLVKSTYTKNHQTYGFKNADVIVELPVGTMGAVFQKRSINENYLGVRNSKGKYSIRLPSKSRTIRRAGVKIIYRREMSPYNDTIEIEGTTTEVIQIVFAYINGTPGGVDYHFLRSRDPGEPVQTTTFEWKEGDWEPCPVTCAAGTQKRQVRCVRSDDKTPANITACDPAVIPSSEQLCNPRPCEPEWHETDWQECSRSCGKGSQARFLLCRRKVNQTFHEILPNTSCDAKHKPADRISFRVCNKVSCPPQWRPLPWSECTVTCGGGITTRGVRCSKTDEDGNDVTLPREICEHKSHEIPLMKECNEDEPCPPPPELEIGCFRGNPLSEQLADFTADLDWQHTDVLARKCAQLSHNKGYKYFALGNNGVCSSGANAKTEYFKNGGARLSDCLNGVGNKKSIFAYSLEPLATLEALGCYKDRKDRALPQKYISVRRQFMWKHPEQTVGRCAHVAWALGYQYFAVQRRGDCWAGKDGANTYDKYGKAPDKSCKRGVGGRWRNSVYRFKERKPQ